MSRLPSAMSRLPGKGRREEGRGGKKEEPRTNIAQPPSELTWENAIVRFGPFNAEAAKMCPPATEFFFFPSQGPRPLPPALKGPSPTIAFSQVSSDGTWAILVLGSSFFPHLPCLFPSLLFSFSYLLPFPPD